MNPISFPTQNLAAKHIERPTLERAAHQFEALLLESLINSLEKGFSVPGGSQTLGTQGYSQLATQNLAGALSQAGGWGISALVTRSLLKTQGVDTEKGL